jgi:hypothetical protein
MSCDGISPVSAASKKDGFPKGIRVWEVKLPVDLDDLLENEAYIRVLADDFVETIYKRFDTRTVGEVGK